MAPATKQITACSQPLMIIQIMLITNLKPFKVLNLGEKPKGQNANLAALKYWMPTGMKIMVIQQIIPQIKKIIAISQPIKASHVTLAKVGKNFSPLIAETINEMIINTNKILPPMMRPIAQPGKDVPLLSKIIVLPSFHRKGHIKCPFVLYIEDDYLVSSLTCSTSLEASCCF